ncbi:DUF5791 family protein [Haladaptatus pallidirubidus]|uniref:DUF5791 family protein n=1 Tax=Haladaptatus pallidirubidus TaxID=1008152 RepID=A0AAV3UKV0_9EURY|nr:DUF5791 family protein [Haladaptatus pallidirubidus]
MLYDEIEKPGESTPEEVHAQYVAELAATIESVGIEDVVAATELDRETVTSVADGGQPELTLEDAAGILATGDAPPKDTILLEVRDHLLMGMTTGVLDIDTLASSIDSDLGARALQQKIEGRASMTLEEYALVHHFIATRNDRD